MSRQSNLLGDRVEAIMVGAKSFWLLVTAVVSDEVGEAQLGMELLYPKDLDVSSLKLIASRIMKHAEELESRR